jgi:hypothetical protein
MGTAADFVLFTSVGAMQNVGTYQYLTLLTGDVGTNSGSNTNFGNVNGSMHAGNGESGQCATDVLAAYNFLEAAIPDSTIVNPVLGNDSTFKAGTYLLPGATSLDKSITLDAQGDANAVFIFKMPAGPPVYAFSTSVNAQVKLINGAQACNVFWFVTGAVSMGTETSMKGTIIAGGSISMAAGNTLEGRALTINGSVTINNGDIGLSAYLPVDIAASLPTGPAAPVFVESKQYAVFSTIGDVSDDGTSHVTGSVGSNTALPTGFNPLFVSGKIEGMNPSTAGAAADLLLVYNSMSTLTADIELLAPAQFGHNLVLTPNSYVMNTAVTFTDTLILDATGNADAVFVIKTYGAFASGVHSNVILKNGTQAKNVFWMVNGAVSIGDSSVFNGTIVANNGAIDLLKGASLDGRALTTNGSISTTGMTTVLPIPMVSINPEEQAVCDGDSAGFVVSAMGMGSYTYQWRKGTVNLSNGGNISGVTNDTLIINPVSASDTSSNYNVIVFDSLEPSDTSGNVSLSFNPVLSITTEPASQAVCAVGNSASFSVSAMGAGLTYQWRKGTVNLTNTGNISGATSATLTVNPVANVDTVSNYNVIISDICGMEVTSANASLTISSDLTINAEPTNQTVCEGSPVSFSIDATGAGLTYQWRKGVVNLSNTGNISGATSATLTIDPVAMVNAASDYNVIVSGTCALNDTSMNVALTVNQPVSITNQPMDKTVCEGSPISFSVLVSGNEPVYQWRKGLVNLSNGANISGVSTNSLSIDTVLVSDASSDYNVLVSNMCAADVTSANASLTVNTATIISLEPMDQTVCEGNQADFSVTATGTNLTYQWRKEEVDLMDGATISGATTANLSILQTSFIDVSSSYSVQVSGTCAPIVVSNDASLAMNSAPVITTEPSDKIATVGESVSFSTTATGIGLVYQWRKGTVDLSNTGNISGATTATLTINPVALTDAASDYNVVVSGTCEPIATSVNVSLEANATGIVIFNADNKAFSVYPNPFTTSIVFKINDISLINNCELKLYNVVGVEIMHTVITKQSTVYETNNLPKGVYFYKVIDNEITIQSGKLISN